MILLKSYNFQMFLFFVSLASCRTFAMLYAGSFTFPNYRHQADIFAIYHMLLERGFSKSDISLYAFDDIATDAANPFKGQVFHTIDHKVNVYPGKDAINVSGGSVDAKRFIKAIKTFPTTSEDNILIYYVNHGGPNLLGTPNGDLISAHNMLYAFQEAQKKNLFKQLLFVIEACYSGSIGKVINLPNITLLTAANNIESSYPIAFDSEVGTFIANEFTNNLLSAIEEKPDATVLEVFTTAQSQTEKSHPCIFGDEAIKALPISEFFGKPTKTVIPRKSGKREVASLTPKEATEKSLSFMAQHQKASIRSKARLELIRLRALTERLEAALELLVKYVDPENYDEIMNDKTAEANDVYYEVLDIFMKKFGEVNPDDYGRFSVIKALAATHTKAEIVQGIFAAVF